MTQELRKLAEAANTTYEERAEMFTQDFRAAWKAKRDFEAAANPAAILELLDRVENAEKDAKLWRNLCDLINDDRVRVTFYGRVNTLNTGLEVHDSGDLHDELDIAMEASK